MFPDRYGPKFSVNPDISEDLIKDFVEDDPTHLRVKTLMSVQDRFMLYYTARKMLLPQDEITFVDIGTWCGGSAIIISKALMREEIKYRGFTIDPRPKESFTRWIYDKFLVGNNVAFIRKCSSIAVENRLVPDKVDLVLLDGRHGYEGVRDDLEHFCPLVRPGGIILIHDAVSRHALNDCQKSYKFMGVYIGGYQAGEDILEKQGWTSLDIPLLSSKTGKPPGYSHLPDIHSLLVGWRCPR